MPNLIDSLLVYQDEISLHLSKNTVANYFQAASRLVEMLEEEFEMTEEDSIKSLTIDHFMRFPLWLAEKQYPKNTQQTYVSGIRNFLDWMIAELYLSPTPADMARFSRSARQAGRMRSSRMPKSITPEEADAIIAQARKMKRQKLSVPPLFERDIAIVEFLSSSGCRVSEMTDLDVGHIDMKNRRAVVIGKGDKEAFIFFSEKARSALANYWKARGFFEPEDPLFCRHDLGASKGKKGSRITPGGVRYIIKKLAKAAGQDPTRFSPHKFRHAFGTRALETTGRLEVVQDLMRHSSPNTTRIYAKISVGELQKYFEEIDED